MANYTELFFRDMTSLGGMFFYGIVLLSAWTLGAIDLARNLVFAGIITTVVAFIIRSIYFKDRPKKQAHSTFLERIDASSFPSIHAARSVSLALIVGKSVQAPLFFAFVLIVAFIVCLSRYYLKKHDTTDIIAGIILGAIVGFLL